MFGHGFILRNIDSYQLHLCYKTWEPIDYTVPTIKDWLPRPFYSETSCAAPSATLLKLMRKAKV